MEGEKLGLQAKPAVGGKGLTLVELLMALLVSAIVLVAIVSLYITSVRTFQTVKDISDAKELGKSGMAQLEWLFQRWGTSTPCLNTNNDLCTQVAVNCQDADSGDFPYPPPSMVCITINSGNPCDEAQFYANLSGNGFVHNPTLADQNLMQVKSCRLSAEAGKNCYHIKLGSQFISDQENPLVYTPLIFSLSNLSGNNLFCTDGSMAPNGTLSANATVLNGRLKNNSGGWTDTYRFEGGEILLRVPHRVRLFCKANPSDRNQNWLYMAATDMASTVNYPNAMNLCNSHEAAQPLVPVNTFRIQTQGQGVVVSMQVRATDGKTLDIQRYFGR
jgi:type II secretory pathway pseudopilin PulG